MEAQEREIAALRSRIAEKVRAARKGLNLPRRVLAERSGVSPRYLAQLEAGQGNASIALLYRVAQALELPPAALIGAQAECGGSAEARAMAARYDQADAQTRAQIRALLGATADRGARLCLIGLRGAGKSTLGAMAGARLGVPFIELNRIIEAQSGMAVVEVMALLGAEGYRRHEAQALEHIAEMEGPLILAAAGGIVDAPQSYAQLLARFHTLWLRAAPAEHMARVRAQGDERPMEGHPQAMAQLRAILARREAQYARATSALDTSGLGLGAALEALLALIESEGFLRARRPEA